MGLAGRKTKQRIGADPRNLTWSQDSAKFGAKYLQSLGWTNGTGLGASGEGRTSNLKIHQKLDLMGIGANRRGPDGDNAGWRGGREFEGLLARLNEAQDADTRDTPMNEECVPDINDSAIDHSTGGAKSTAREGSVEINTIDGEKVTTGRKGDVEVEKKRKRCAMKDEEAEAKEAKRRRKEERRGKKDRKRAEKAAKGLGISHNCKSGPGDKAQVPVAHEARELVQATEAVKVAPRYRAHRARNIASKRLAAVSVMGMNEILGISSPTASGPKADMSIPFPTACLSQKHAEKGNDSQPSSPGLFLSPATDDSGAAAAGDGTDVPTIGFGSHFTFNRGLGIPSAREETNALEEHGGNDLLRKSGKSVAEYFAEKLRMKGTTKEIPTFNEAESPQRKKRGKGVESIL